MADRAGTVRIGVYVCRCGTNIAGVIDTAEVARQAGKLPDVVVSRDINYTCSGAGLTALTEDIREHGLNRVVIASCSPLLHEHTFRRAVAKAGVNAYQLQMVNIREQGAWVHEDRAQATVKALDLVRAAARRVRIHRKLERKVKPVSPEALVVGGGVAGIHAALTIAEAGRLVHLVERMPYLGGHVALYDKTFPTLDGMSCLLTPKTSAVATHPNIKLWSFSEVTQVDGFVGDFRVTVTKKPRFVKEDLCVGCLACIDACIAPEGSAPDAFNFGLSGRKPVYVPHAQAAPNVALIDPETCIEFKPGKCRKTCLPACEHGAIDFTQGFEEARLKVGAVILATGFESYDAAKSPKYGYGKYPNVYTSLEAERLVNTTGPTKGEVVLRDGRAPKAIGVIHCVGSRNENTNRWCSRVCCMASLKLAHQLKERTGAEVYNFYIDMRTPGKGYEEFYDRLLEEGNHFIRGRVAEVTDSTISAEEEGRLVIRAEDTMSGFARRVPVDMVVLAVGMQPRADAGEVRRMFGITRSADGFFMERHARMAPVNTLMDGVMVAGCCQGPRDISDTVAQAGAAASEVLAILDRGRIESDPNTAYLDGADCSGCAVCVDLCPYRAISFDLASRKAVINEVLCKACGVCVAACPSGAIRQHMYEDDEIMSEIEGVLDRG